MNPVLIHEDASLIVVNKPSGMSVHEDGKHDYPTITAWVLKHYPDIKGVGEPQTLSSGVVVERPGIVHRLDRETSGILLIARTQASFENLKNQFKTREIQKTYRAFIYDTFAHDRGIIDRPIGSNRNGMAPRSARDPKGTTRDAVTVYKVLGKSSEASYIEAFPKTGRTHQIRAHFAAVQHPIIHDFLYAPARKPLLGFTRLALHALSLTFSHPKTGKRVTFEVPLPEDFSTAEKLLHEA